MRKERGKTCDRSSVTQNKYPVSCASADINAAMLLFKQDTGKVHIGWCYMYRISQEHRLPTKLEQILSIKNTIRRQSSWLEAISFELVKHWTILGRAPDKDDGRIIQMFTVVVTSGLKAWRLCCHVLRTAP